jgi:hypothetical protein
MNYVRAVALIFTARHIGVCKSLWMADFFELSIFEKSELVIRS